MARWARACSRRASPPAMRRSSGTSARRRCVRAVHQGFVDAGSDLILTNSFGANRRRLALHGAEGRVAELNRAAAGLARGGGRWRRSRGPGGGLDRADRRHLRAGRHARRGRRRGGLRRAGRRRSPRAAAICSGSRPCRRPRSCAPRVAGAAPTGLPIVATMTFDTHGRTMMGLTTAAAMALCGAARRPPGRRSAPIAASARRSWSRACSAWPRPRRRAT